MISEVAGARRINNIELTALVLATTKSRIDSVSSVELDIGWITSQKI